MYMCESAVLNHFAIKAFCTFRNNNWIQILFRKVQNALIVKWSLWCNILSCRYIKFVAYFPNVNALCLSLCLARTLSHSNHEGLHMVHKVDWSGDWCGGSRHTDW
jgi:hypothetical protein